MRKFLLPTIVLLLGMIASCGVAKANYGYLSVPTGGNREFTPLTQHKFEKQETLDFINKSEEYKDKRAKQEKYLDYQYGKVDVPPSVQSQYSINESRPGSNNMQFIKDENGKIKIQGF